MKKYLSLSLILFLFLGMLSPVGAYSQEDSNPRLLSDTENSVSEQVLEEPTKISQAYYKNYTYLEIVLSDKPEKRPTFRSVEIARYIDGKLDENFKSDNLKSFWNIKTNTLEIMIPKSNEDAKYEVKFIDEPDIEIVDVTQHDYTNLYIFFTKRPETIPSPSKMDITRIINGKEDTEFEWNSEPYSWVRQTNMLNIYNLPYDEDLEILYNVSYLDSEPITVDTEMPLMTDGFLYQKKGVITLTFDTSLKRELALSDLIVIRSINGGEYEEVEMLDLFFIDERTVSIRIPPDRAPDIEQSVEYSVSLNGIQSLFLKPLTIEDNALIGIEEARYRKLTDLEILLSDVPKVQPNATSVDIVRYINGKLDKEFKWTNEKSIWDKENKTLTIKQIEFVEGAQYKVTYEDPTISIEDVTKTDNQVFDIILTGIPSEDPTALSVNTTRTINGQPDNEFVWSGGNSSWYISERKLRIYDIPLPEPTDVEQVVIYTLSYNDSTVELEPIVVPAKNDKCSN